MSKVPDLYIDNLEDQFKDAQKFFSKEKIRSLNFGGGTPNLLSPSQLKTVLDMIKDYWDLELTPDNERGFEFHPHLMSDAHLQVLKSSYINRVSMGVQSFDPEVLKAENRIWVSKDRIKEVYHAVKEFADLVNIDLLIGLFKQTPEILVDDVSTLLSLGSDWITMYVLGNLPSQMRRSEHTQEDKSLMLNRVLQECDYSNYLYGGKTVAIDNDCNRFYKKESRGGFKYFYNTSPQGFNNTLAFGINRLDGDVHPYSFFQAADSTYRLEYNGQLNLHKISEDERFWWQDEYFKRFGKKSN